MRRCAALALATLALGGCGGEDERGSGDLQWESTPKVYVPSPGSPDRVLAGAVRNQSLRRIDLTAGDLRLLDRDGREVRSAAIFVRGFLHGLYPPTREPPELPASELRRTGRIAQIRPGDSVPLTVSWRVAPRAASPERIDYGAGSLPVPRVDDRRAPP